MFVRQMIPVARRHVAVVRPDTMLAEVASQLCLEHINLAVVCDAEGAMVGVITDSDLVRCMHQCDPASGHVCTASAATAMTRNVVSCHIKDRLREAGSTMKEHGLRHIPVLDDKGRPVGVLYARDVLHELFEELQFEEREMKDFFLGIGYR